MFKVLKRFWWLWILVALNLIFFHKLFLGQLPIPIDGLSGIYYPWYDYHFGYPNHVPVKNAALTDIFSQLYIWRSLSIDLIKQGELPLWNPYYLSGTPLLANLQAASLYPLNLFML